MVDSVFLRKMKNSVLDKKLKEFPEKDYQILVDMGGIYGNVKPRDNKTQRLKEGYKFIGKSEGGNYVYVIKT